MRLLFVFVFFSSVAFGQISTSSVDFGQIKRPNCEDIKGLETCVFTQLPENYTGNLKCCRDGKVKIIRQIKDGLKDGLDRHWDKNGQLWLERNYKEGKLDGIYRSWHENGQLSYKGNFKNGDFISEKCFDVNGKAIKCEEE